MAVRGFHLLRILVPPSLSLTLAPLLWLLISTFLSSFLLEMIPFGKKVPLTTRSRTTSLVLRAAG
jgi:hypothetical protein